MPFFTPGDVVFSDGKNTSSVRKSREGRDDLIALFGGEQNLPSSVMRAKRRAPDEADEICAGGRGYSATAPGRDRMRDKKIPEELRKAYQISGRGCEAGALSRFPQNVGRSVVLLYSEPGDLVFDPFCLTPETWIIVSGAMKRIKDVSVGDYVLTHRGRYKPVLKTMVREVNEDITVLNVSGSPPLKITNNHSVLVIRTTRCGYSGRIALPSCSTCREGECRTRPVEGDANYRGFRPRKCFQPWLDYRPEWVPAGEVRVGDYVLFPSAGEERASESISLRGYAKVDRDRDRSIALDDDCLWLMGMYVAEGHVGGGTGITWTVGSHEKHYADRIAKIAEGRFRCSAKVRLRRDGTVYDVITSKSQVARCLLDQFGHRAWNKRLPRWLMELPVSKQSHFICGYVQGDGCVISAKSKAGEGVAVVTTSPHLAGQTKVLLLRQGVASAVSCRTPSKINRKDKWGIVSRRDAWRVSVTGAGVVKMEEVLKMGLGQVKHYSSYSFPCCGYMAHRVLSVGSLRYEGNVHNLSVEGDESYTTISGVVHNCGHNSRMDLTVKAGRHYTGCDLSTEFMTFNFKRAETLRRLYPQADIRLHHCDSRKVPVDSESADCTVSSPPYWDIEYYGDEPQQLGKKTTYEGFLKGLRRVLRENFRVLKAGAYCVWFVNDFRRKGKMYFYHADLIRLGEDVGFTAHDILITDLGKGIRDCFLNQTMEQKILPKRHEYGIVFRKQK